MSDTLTTEQIAELRRLAAIASHRTISIGFRDCAVEALPYIESLFLFTPALLAAAEESVRLKERIAEVEHECNASMVTIAEERARAETAEARLAEANKRVQGYYDEAVQAYEQKMAVEAKLAALQAPADGDELSKEQLLAWLKEASDSECRQCDGGGIFYGNVHICACVQSTAETRAATALLVLQAREAKLVEALRPFADAALPEGNDNIPIVAGHHFRRARALIGDDND